jgi:hypothetical protein
MPAAALENCIITDQTKNFDGDGGSVNFTPICPNCGQRDRSQHSWLRCGRTETDSVHCDKCHQSFRYSVAWM